jgi:four helix bundle protein
MEGGLDHAAWMHTVLAGIDRSAVVLYHWARAAESIIENIANGNSRRSRSDRNLYFDVAIGSALECAACLDVCHCRKMISDGQRTQGKKMLHPILSMTIGLREAESAYVREESATYSSGKFEGDFAHERLDAYKVALKLVVWFHHFLGKADIGASYVKRLDKGTTSLVLNIAEGNGRFSEADQTRFLDIAHTCAMRVAACLDVLVVRRQVQSQQIAEGKQLLARVVPLVLGLRGYHDDSEPKA